MDSLLTHLRVSIDRWLHASLSSEEALLHDAHDLYELEQRVRDLDRRSVSLMSTPSQSMYY